MIIFYTLFVLFIIISLRYHWWRVPISDDQPRVLMYHMIKEHMPQNKKRNKWRVKPKDFEKQMAWF